MIEAGQVALFVPAALALNALPGPDMLYCVGTGIGRGPRAGIVAALGISAGLAVHVAAAAAGVAALVAAAPLAFDAVRLAGAAWLAWVGIGALRHPPALTPGQAAPAGDLWAVLWGGAATNVLNAKVILFVLAFLPPFVRPEAGPPAAQLLALGGLLMATSTLVNGAVGAAAGALARALAARPGLARGIGRAIGLVLLAAAAGLLVGGRPA